MSLAARLAVVLSLGVVASTTAPAAADTTVVALVASNAAQAFADIAAAYEKKHPGVKIAVSAAGSKVIVAQLEQGAAADLIVVSTAFAEGSKSVESPVHVFANHTVISAAKSGKVKAAKDMATSGVRMASGTSGSVGAQIADETLAKLAAQFGADFPAKVKGNVGVTKTALEQEQRAVEEGLADATIVFAADADTGKTNVIELGDKSVSVSYSAAVVKGSKNGGAAREILALMASAEGQAIFKKHHHDTK